MMNFKRHGLFVLLAVFIISLPLVQAGKSDKKYEDMRVEKIIRVYDGDTFTADLGPYPRIAGAKAYPPIISKEINIRIDGIDTPEMRDKDERIKKLAVQARDFVRQILMSSESIILKNIKRGKYFRIVATVWCDGVNIADLLIKKGLAKPYDGGTKPDWSQAVVVS